MFQTEDAKPDAVSTTTAPPVEGASKPPAGMTRLHIFEGMFQGLPSKVKVFGTSSAAKKAFKEFTGVDYDAYAKWEDDGRPDDLPKDSDGDPWNEELDGTEIELQDVLIRECETLGCPDHYIGEKKEGEYHCEAHQESDHDRLQRETGVNLGDLMAEDDTGGYQGATPAEGSA